MNRLSKPDIYLALLHYPVVNKKGDEVASAVTNLDLHDMARLSKTYGLKALYIVTPLPDQTNLVKQIVSHWTEGAGGVINPARKKALELIKIRESFEEILHEFQADGKKPSVIVTSAKESQQSTSFAEVRDKITDGNPAILVFGTAWGLTPGFLEKSDWILEPVRGAGDYNHLSVRSAASIILDRLLGQRDF